MNSGFRYFPEKLYRKPVPILNIAPTVSKMFGFSKGTKESFYSVKDGSWSDITTWETGSGRRMTRIPSATDDVFIRTSVFVDVAAPCFNCYNNGVLIYSAGTGLSVVGDFKSTGDILNSLPIFLAGYNNEIDTTRTLVLGTVTYQGTSPNISQPILVLPYSGLSLGGTWFKHLTGPTICTSFSNPSSNAYFEFGSHNFTCTGAWSSNGLVFCNGSPYILMIGFVTIGTQFLISGSPTFEFRGGHGAISTFPAGFWPYLVSPYSPTGFGKFHYTTNNQSLTGYITAQISNATENLIGSGVTITQLAGSNTLTVQHLQGTDATSSYILQGSLYFANAVNYQMTIGTFDYLTANTSVGYIFNGSINIPYLTYRHLRIAGTGIKTFTGAATMQNGMNVGAGGTVKLGGNTLIQGAVLLEGSSGTIDTNGFILECQAGIGGGLISGSGSLLLTTNNQVFGTAAGSNSSTSVNILISGAITVSTPSTNVVMTITGILNGNNAASKFENKNPAIGYTAYQNAQEPMQTGLLECNTAANIWRYDRNGAQDIKGGTYRTLQFGGTGAGNVKKLLGNVVINATAGGAWSIIGGSSATIDYNGFTITTI